MKGFIKANIESDSISERKKILLKLEFNFENSDFETEINNDCLKFNKRLRYKQYFGVGRKESDFMNFLRKGEISLNQYTDKILKIEYVVNPFYSVKVSIITGIILGFVYWFYSKTEILDLVYFSSIVMIIIFIVIFVSIRIRMINLIKSSI